MKKVAIILSLVTFVLFFMACEEHKLVFKVRYQVICGTCSIRYFDQTQEWKQLDSLKGSLTIEWFGEKGDSANIDFIPGDSNKLLKLWVNELPITSFPNPDTLSSIRHKLDL